MHKYCFIGAGVSNIFAINYLLKNNIAGKDILLFEKGKPLKERSCPSINTRCTHCEIDCPVISGFGGSSAFYGNKFCYFPSSSKILDYTNNNDFQEAMDFIQSILGFSYDKNFNNVNNKKEEGKKVYYSEVITQNNYKKLLNRLISEIASRITIVNKKVENINLKNGLFEVSTSDKNYESKKLIIGTGRSSDNLIQDLLNITKVDYIINDPDVGIRIEADFRNFSKDYYYQNDPKFKIYTAFGNSRSFCAVNKGYIVPVKYKKFYYAEGVFLNEQSGVNNIALMSRIYNGPKINEIEKWAREMNVYFKNRLLADEISISNNKLELKNQIINIVPYWPDNRYKILLSKLLDEIIGDRNFIFKIDERTRNKIRLYVPAIDNYWISPKVLQNLETSVDGLFFVGDIIGVSRGIIQSIYSGIVWAINELRRVNKNVETKSKYLWHYLE